MASMTNYVETIPCLSGLAMTAMCYYNIYFLIVVDNIMNLSGDE